jgi:hypothetical protein
MGLLILLLARLLQLQRFTVLPSQGQPRDLETGNLETSCYVHQQGFSGTHKNLQRLVICPIYSVVKYRPRWLAPAARLSGYGSYSFQSRANPRIPPTQCSTPIRIDVQHQIEFWWS